MKARDIAFIALCAALSMVALYAANLLPTLKIALAVLTSVITAVAVVRCGKRGGFMEFAVTAALALLILPSKPLAVVYCLLLGHYSVCKSVIEGINKLWLEWALKIVLFNACAALIYFLWKLLFEVALPFSVPVLFLGGNVLFVIYDIALTVLIDFIVKRTRLSKGSR